jgi:hypothetical protein
MPIAPLLLRAGLRALNASGHLLERFGRLPVALDEPSLIEAAHRLSGLRDFGGEEFREPLRILLRGYEAEARLTLLGRIAARRDTVSLLANRLRLVDDRARHPGIAEERIERPLFIVGLPRTGSTLLHHLLAQDPRSRVAQAWEVMMPSPPPERARYETDPRIREAERQLRWLDRLAPDFKAIHPLGAQLALECIAIMGYTFLSPRFHTTYHVPTYQEWLERQDLRPAYAFHRKVLQHLQWRAPAERWVLKAPSHLWGLEALFATYPDALVVQTHRDPLTALASVASLTAVLQAAFTDDVNLAEIGLEVTRRWATGLERAMQVRRAGTVPAERFLDVNYRELVADPLGLIRRLYTHFDLPFSDEAARRMRRHLANYPKDKHGAHAYSLAALGLDHGELAHRFKGYCEHFGIGPEATAEAPAD